MLTPNRIISATLFSKYMNKSQGAIFGIRISKYISQNVLFYVADFKDLRCFELRFVFFIPWEMYGCLTIAITAAPAPARAQMNRWKVMSSCSKNKSQHILLFKHYSTCQPMKIISVIVLLNVHLILFLSTNMWLLKIYNAICMCYYRQGNGSFGASEQLHQSR